MKIYMVRNNKGQYYRRKGYAGYRKTWVDDPQRASVWTTYQGPANVLSWCRNTGQKAERIDLEIDLEKTEVSEPK